MFKTDLTIEEESLLHQILDEEKLERFTVLLNIKSLADNTTQKEGIEIAKSLFEKIKNTSDYEYNEYINLLLKQFKD